MKENILPTVGPEPPLLEYMRWFFLEYRDLYEQIAQIPSGQSLSN